jgi:hypothetical protein
MKRRKFRMALSSGNSVQLDASEAAHALDFIQRIFHAGVRQGVPVLHEVDAQHALEGVGALASAGGIRAQSGAAADAALKLRFAPSHRAASHVA